MTIETISIPILAILGGGVASYINSRLNKGEIEREKERIDKLDKQLNGNGQEGLMVKVGRLDEKTNNIETSLERIENKLDEAVKK